MPRTVNLDDLNQVNAEQAGRAAFRVIDSIQTLPPEEQVAGATLAFAALIEKYDLSHSQAFRVADNIMREAYARVPELKALVAYVAGEL